jgi:hypothetical protein
VVYLGGGDIRYNAANSKVDSWCQLSKGASNPFASRRLRFSYGCFKREDWEESTFTLVSKREPLLRASHFERREAGACTAHFKRSTRLNHDIGTATRRIASNDPTFDANRFSLQPTRAELMHLVFVDGQYDPCNFHKQESRAESNPPNL